MNTSPYDSTVRRAALPEVLHASDIALALGIPETEAERCAARGQFGPSFLIGGHPTVLRDSFLRHLAQEATTPPSKEVVR